MTVSNRFRRTLRTRGAACVTMLENGRAIVGFFDRAGWQALTVRRLAQASPDALLTLLTQEAQSVNIAPLPERLFVAALEDPRMQLSAGEWPIRMLSLQPRVGFSPFDDARYAMALCGAA